MKIKKITLTTTQDTPKLMTTQMEYRFTKLLVFGDDISSREDKVIGIYLRIIIGLALCIQLFKNLVPLGVLMWLD